MPAFNKAEIIESLGDSYVINCGFCGGHGFVPDCMDDWKITAWSGSQCPVCDGKGVLRVESPDIPVYHLSCRGTGHLGEDEPDLLQKCTTCHGVGVMSLSGQLKVIK
jgi:DnaJ-class molecular chaperone